MSLAFLADLGCDPSNGWVVCNPYGTHDGPLLEMLRGRNYRLGLTTRVGHADLTGDPLLLAGLDTNDLPCEHATPDNAPEPLRR